MAYVPKQRHIAYRCQECGQANLALIGKFALKANMLRVRCDCKEDADSLDITVGNDSKIRLSVPCLFCKQKHSYVVSNTIFFEREQFLLNCPYSGCDIAIIGDKEVVDRELERTHNELLTIRKSLEAEELSDIQPQDMNEDEILPDPAVYDTIRFIVKDLEEEGKVKCPCGDGEYELRYFESGVEVYCTKCGATYQFHAESAAVSESYLDLDEITLS